MKLTNTVRIIVTEDGFVCPITNLIAQENQKLLNVINNNNLENINKINLENIFEDINNKILALQQDDQNQGILKQLYELLRKPNPTKEEYITHRGSRYTLSTREELFNLNGFFSSAKYSPSGQLIALCDMHGSCAIFYTHLKEINYFIKKTLSCYDRIDAIDFDPTGHILAIIPSLGKSIEYWNVETRNLIAISELPEQYTTIE